MKRIEEFVATLARPSELLEKAMDQLLTERGIDSAIGQQLDDLGKIVNQPRYGLDDDPYRRLLRAKISANRSKSTAEDLITITRLVADPDAIVELTPFYPAAIRVVVDNVAVAVATNSVLLDLLRVSVAGGVRLTLETSPTLPGDTFAFDGANEAKGFGDVNDPDVGGQLSSVVE